MARPTERLFFHCFHFELEFRSVGFSGGRKIGAGRKSFSRFSWEIDILKWNSIGIYYKLFLCPFVRRARSPSLSLFQASHLTNLEKRGTVYSPPLLEESNTDRVCKPVDFSLFSWNHQRLLDYTTSSPSIFLVRFDTGERARRKMVAWISSRARSFILPCLSCHAR